MDREHLVEELVTFARKLSQSGLSPGRSGNLSIRLKDSILITPSALPYDEMTAGDIVQLDLEGSVTEGDRRPSSEWPFHAAIYRNFHQAGAIVHSHSSHATTLACLGHSIPAFHYMVAVAGGQDIRCSEYATFGSSRLAEFAIDALQDRKACLLGNHGQIAWHHTLAQAYELAWDVENLSMLYCNALKLGNPRILDDAEMDRVLERFRNYQSEKP